ncbi:SDR family oxidoreductase [Blastococcus goldschmidtiae]|uniref:SDR family oxidoreductase n=1 Tax=Blastococcus goldschmidtiae TaxID=3075546 RepID=A0ABU2K6T1_9ACTN|nr:SDR family oxidoreductase [Blastococcus sp. DSM 46792]MDT0275905.1 SDR family oxidoreductase [Blastococcus sp. DSM 46792]
MSATSQRVVVITGASSGIGRETARHFAAQGAAVVLAARGEPALHATAEEVTRAGGTALVVPTDVAVWPQVEHLAKSTREHFGRIDVWVNNAAVSGYGELNTMPVEAIHRILDVDLRGHVYGVKAVLPILREQGHGAIIGVSSGLGVRAVPLMIPYCIAKSGVNALYEGLRLEERRARSGVRITTILPASIDTPFYDSARSWMGVRPAPIPPVYQPKAVAEAVVFAADHPRRDIYIGAAAQLAMVQRISPALTDRLLALGGQVFTRQQRDEPDRGQSNLTEPTPGDGAVDGGVVRFALPRSRWTRLVGFHPALARSAAIASVGTIGWRLARRGPARPR